MPLPVKPWVSKTPRSGCCPLAKRNPRGNDQVRQARQLLSDSPLNFIGNVEGRDVFSGEADVVVCDGFVGNVGCSSWPKAWPMPSGT